MAERVFVSYSHADERYLERLHKHLVMLQRAGLLSAWFDHAILPGAVLNSEIVQQLDTSSVFLAIVSPDYLASNYCYEKEFQHALALAEADKIRIVPVIVEPCDWLSSPLSQFMALPKDGKPISEWTNANNAYLDVVGGLRRLLSTPEQSPRYANPPATLSAETPARRVRLKRDFDAIERAEFRDRTFSVVRNYFAAAGEELAQASEDVRTRLEDMSPAAFTCTIVNRALQRGGEAHITVRNNRGGRGFGDISYVFQAHAADNTSNGEIRVEADDYNLYLVTGSWMGTRDDGAKQTPERAAEWLWNQFVERAGVEYE